MLQLLTSITKGTIKGAIPALIGVNLGWLVASIVMGAAVSPAWLFNAILIIFCASALGTCIGMLVWGSPQNSKPPAKES